MTTHPDESVYQAAAEQVAILHGYHNNGDPADLDRYVARQVKDTTLRCIVDTTWSQVAPAQQPTGDPVAAYTGWAARLTGPDDMPPRVYPIVNAATEADARSEFERDWGAPRRDGAQVELVVRAGVKYSCGSVRLGPWTVVGKPMNSRTEWEIHVDYRDGATTTHQYGDEAATRAAFEEHRARAERGFADRLVCRTVDVYADGREVPGPWTVVDTTAGRG